MILVWVWYIYFIKNPTLFVSQKISNTWIPITWLIFVNDTWFTKQPIGWLEALKEEPSGLVEVEKCKIDPTNFWWIQECDAMQKELDTFVLGDYFFEYSGFIVIVLDTSKVVWHKESIQSWMIELTEREKFPKTYITKLLTKTTRINWMILSPVIEITDKQFVNADIFRIFISFEWQDWYIPVIHMIFKKWDYLVSITNDKRIYNNNWFWSDLHPEVGDIIQKFRNFVVFDSTKQPNEQEIIEYYNKNIATHSWYQKLLNETINNLINRFAIK